MGGDLISRAKALAMHKDECSGDCGCCKYVTRDLECGILLNVPAVDAEPVRHGRWIAVHEPKSGRSRPLLGCSACNSMTHHDFNYCPNCGAKMNEEE